MIGFAAIARAASRLMNLMDGSQRIPPGDPVFAQQAQVEAINGALEIGHRRFDRICDWDRIKKSIQREKFVVDRRKTNRTPVVRVM